MHTDANTKLLESYCRWQADRMSLKSVMFAGYNKFDDAKVRIGSWREELALKELTGVTRLADYSNKAVFNATGPR